MHGTAGRAHAARVRHRAQARRADFDVASPWSGSARLDGCSEVDQGMLQFASAACSEDVAFEPDIAISTDVWDAVHWVNERSSDHIIAERERIIQSIEDEARELHASGAVHKWFDGADAGVRTVAQGVNGPLLRELAVRTDFQDLACVDFFRAGAPAIGPLPVSGSGVPAPRAEAQPISALLSSAQQENRVLVGTLKEDATSETLLQQLAQEVKLGRITSPTTAERADLSSSIISPRFGARQSRPDGCVKVRPVDDLSRSGVNGSTSVGEKFRPEAVDALYRVTRSLAQGTREALKFYKADIDAAIRRIPVMPVHRCFLFFVFLVQGIAHVAGHMAMPFGAVASVHAMLGRG